MGDGPFSHDAGHSPVKGNVCGAETAAEGACAAEIQTEHDRSEGEQASQSGGGEHGKSSKESKASRQNH